MSLFTDLLGIPVDPALPQDNPNCPKRKNWLEKNRKAYQYNHAFWEPLPLLNTSHQGLPFAEWPSVQYLVTRIFRTLPLPLNQIFARIHAIFDRIDTSEDYADLLTVLPKPSLIEHYDNDECFAEQRLSGVNPVVIQHLTSLPAGCESSLQALGESLDLMAELENGNLYITDYSHLDLSKGTYRSKRQYLPAPTALFHLPEGGKLKPLGIQIEPVKPLEQGKPPCNQSDLGSIWITPNSESTAWKYAKLCVQTADANYHELITHLFRTHLAMEPFAIATARQLAKNHPLGILLRPHFRFMLFNGDLARTRLVGYIDRLIAGTPADVAKLLEKAHAEWSFDQFAFPQEIANRGMGEDKIAHYPYRDDGMLVWDAIRDFVSSYLRLYYPFNDILQNDAELNAWASELVSPTEGRVEGLKTPIETIEELIEIVTNLIFNCGPQHSAVNYSQYEYMTYMPNMPLTTYQPIRKDGNVKDDLKLVPFLPPRTQATEQLAIVYILAVPYFYDKLGHYKQGFADRKAQECAKDFRDALKKIDEEIHRRNNHRSVKYPYFKPSQILNSISM